MIIKRIAIRKGKINAIFFDNCTAVLGELTDDGGLILDRGLCESEGLKVGDDISEEKLESLVEHSACLRAKSRAVWLLESRDYTQRGMYNKLRPLYGEYAAEFAASYCAQIGLIDDERFAERMAYSLSQRGVSDREAVRRLISKGVAREVATAAVEGAQSDPAAQLEDIIRKKYALRLESGDKKETERVVAALARKGFGFGDIRRAIAKFSDAEIFEN